MRGGVRDTEMVLDGMSFLGFLFFDSRVDGELERAQMAIM